MLEVITHHTEQHTLAHESGITIQEMLEEELVHMPEQDLMDALNHLIEEGHIYSTINEHTFKATPLDI